MESNTWHPRSTAEMILSGSAVQMKGLGSLLDSAMKRLMAASTSSARASRRRAFRFPPSPYDFVTAASLLTGLTVSLDQRLPLTRRRAWSKAGAASSTEACATSHHWSRELTALGHSVRLIPPAYVKPYIFISSRVLEDSCMVRAEPARKCQGQGSNREARCADRLLNEIRNIAVAGRAGNEVDPSHSTI